MGRFQVERLLQGLSLEQLKKAAEVAEILLSNVTIQSITLPERGEGSG
jgi:hypothetical protein